MELVKYNDRILANGSKILKNDSTLDVDAEYVTGELNITNTGFQYALNKYFKLLKQNNLWAKRIALYPFWGSGFDESHKYNFFDLNSTLTKVGAGALSGNNSGLSTSATSCVDTGFTSTTIGGLGGGKSPYLFFVRRNDAATTNPDMGAMPSSANQYHELTAKNDSGNAVFECQTSYVKTIPVSSSVGLYGGGTLYKSWGVTISQRKADIYIHKINAAGEFKDAATYLANVNSFSNAKSVYIGGSNGRYGAKYAGANLYGVSGLFLPLSIAESRLLLRMTYNFEKEIRQL